MPARSPHVALLIETSREYGRRLLRGVAHYLHKHDPWVILFRPAGLTDLAHTWLRDWKGDGLLIRADSPQLLNAVVRTGRPAVELRFAFHTPQLPVVGIDSQAVVELGFRHLWERGFRNFAFCGLPSGETLWADLRQQCFEQLAAAAGCSCYVFPARCQSQRQAMSEGELTRLADWLATLKKPVGLMACNDDRGQQVLEACRLRGLLVPDEVAVLGVDNDVCLCNLSTPPLSSINIGAERIGYEAAALLDRLMAGGRAPAQPTLLPPLGVVVRRSTDVVASENRELAELIRFVRDNACGGLRVNEALRRSNLSQSTLQRRFKALLGRTPKQEILRVQLERAKQLLAETDLTVAEIAVKCGFGELKHLSGAFRARMGVAPLIYRRQLRLQGSCEE
ncbi:MAG TPA: DNA-binding transcriptional regulator [Gemmataceae bacterium]|nr:DNA-binding transcriptional regulator [Gemmataceae bacterium]